jgi:hypothetical protein
MYVYPPPRLLQSLHLAYSAQPYYLHPASTPRHSESSISFTYGATSQANQSFYRALPSLELLHRHQHLPSAHLLHPTLNAASAISAWLFDCYVGLRLFDQTFSNIRFPLPVMT